MGIATTTLTFDLPDNHDIAKMGRVRTKTVKKSAKVIIERYYPKLTLDFETDKRICNEIAIIASKRLRNKIAGYTTHLMKRIQRGPVRGISFKLQEESVRERINTSQRSPLSTSPRTRTVDNSRSTPRQRICSRALVSIPSQSVSSPPPNNKPSSPAAVSATTVLHAHRFRLRYEVRKQAKKSRLKDGILVRVSGLGCFLGVFAGCSAGWMDGLRILDQCEIFPT